MRGEGAIPGEGPCLDGAEHMWVNNDEKGGITCKTWNKAHCLRCHVKPKSRHEWGIGHPDEYIRISSVTGDWRNKYHCKACGDTWMQD